MKSQVRHGNWSFSLRRKREREPSTYARSLMNEVARWLAVGHDARLATCRSCSALWNGTRLRSMPITRITSRDQGIAVRALQLLRDFPTFFVHDDFLLFFCWFFLTVARRCGVCDLDRGLSTLSRLNLRFSFLNICFLSMYHRFNFRRKYICGPVNKVNQSSRDKRLSTSTVVFTM